MPACLPDGYHTMSSSSCIMTPAATTVGGPLFCRAMAWSVSRHRGSSRPITPQLSNRRSPHSLGDSPTLTMENRLLPRPGPATWTASRTPGSSSRMARISPRRSTDRRTQTARTAAGFRDPQSSRRTAPRRCVRGPAARDSSGSVRLVRRSGFLQCNRRRNRMNSPRSALVDPRTAGRRGPVESGFPRARARATGRSDKTPGVRPPDPPRQCQNRPGRRRSGTGRRTSETRRRRDDADAGVTKPWRSQGSRRKISGTRYGRQ